MALSTEVTDTEICRKRGDTFTIEITVTNKTTGAVEDVTGNSFTLSVSPEDSPTAPLYEFQSTGVIVDAANGRVDFPISVSDADRVGFFFFDIEMLGGGLKTTIMGGTFEFTQDITK